MKLRDGMACRCDLNAGAVSEGGDGAVVGEALQLALAFHGHARHHVLPMPPTPTHQPGRVRATVPLPWLAMRTRSRTARTAAAPSRQAAPRRRRRPARGRPRRRRPLPRDPPHQRALRRTRTPAAAAGIVVCAEEGGVEHGDGVEARESEQLGVAVAAVDHLVVARQLAAARRPLRDDPGRRVGGGGGARAVVLGPEIRLHGITNWVLHGIHYSLSL